MKRITKAVLPALAVSAAVLGLAACAGTYDDYYGYGYGYPYDYGYGPYYSGYYGDCFGAYYDAFCDYPVFGGAVFIGGRSFHGLHYRNTARGREFWNGHVWQRPDGGTFRGSVTARAAPRVTPVPRALGHARVAGGGGNRERFRR